MGNYFEGTAADLSKLGDGFGDYGGSGGAYSAEDDMSNPAYWLSRGLDPVTRQAPVIPPADYVNAFSPSGTHTSTNKGFEDTMSAAVKKADPSFSVRAGYAAASEPVAAAGASPMPKLLGAVALVAIGYFVFFKKNKRRA